MHKHTHNIFPMANLKNVTVLVFIYICQETFISTHKDFFFPFISYFLWSMHLIHIYKLVSVFN